MSFVDDLRSLPLESDPRYSESLKQLVNDKIARMLRDAEEDTMHSPCTDPHCRTCAAARVAGQYIERRSC